MSTMIQQILVKKLNETIGFLDHRRLVQ